jgi:hypothetical protein
LIINDQKCPGRVVAGGCIEPYYAPFIGLAKRSIITCHATNATIDQFYQLNVSSMPKIASYEYLKLRGSTTGSWDQELGLFRIPPALTYLDSTRFRIHLLEMGR